MDSGFQPAGRAPAPPPLDLVQDFVNTEITEWARDDIATPALLEDWLRERRLLAAGESVSAADFVAARELRAALRRLALLNNVGEIPDEELRRSLRRALSAAELRVEIDDRGRLVPVGAGAGAERALSSIVAVVLEAEGSGSWRRLKACRKESCGWLFYDASRNNSSSWCSMSICGNRVKTAAYRRRRRATS
ncbi:MAG: CGNR zinc finger domain-containing protein [Gaiellaceae bacterium]